MSMRVLRNIDMLMLRDGDGVVAGVRGGHGAGDDFLLLGGAADAYAAAGDGGVGALVDV